MVKIRRILFIAPSSRTGRDNTPGHTLFPPLGLAMLAALTPATWNLQLIDEAVEPASVVEPPDVVAITSITAVAPRAYGLARWFRHRGSWVILGGMHPSAVPDEAAQFADSVVVGEAEPVWGQVLRDVEQGRLKPRYQAARPPDLAGLPVPRRDLFRHNRYLTTSTVQTSRGCPHACDFCSVSRFFGTGYRVRPVDEVMAEIEGLRSRTVLFVDDNIVGNPAHARELFRALKRSGIRWAGQSSLNIARDPELLALAAASGCIGLFIGFESLVADNLSDVGKRFNRVSKYQDAIDLIHRHGIGIQGAFIFGFDRDTEMEIRRTIEFARENRLEAAQFGILTPFPGTRLWDRLESEGRIIDRDWSRYTISRVVFEPRAISGQRLARVFLDAYRSFYSYPCILSRLLPALRRNLQFYLPLNMAFRRIVANLQVDAAITPRSPAGDG